MTTKSKLLSALLAVTLITGGTVATGAFAKDAAKQATKEERACMKKFPKDHDGYKKCVDDATKAAAPATKQ
jgi:hypothetical protein